MLFVMIIDDGIASHTENKRTEFASDKSNVPLTAGMP